LPRFEIPYLPLGGLELLVVYAIIIGVQTWSPMTPVLLEPQYQANERQNG
jgi:hypothetical protein